MNSRDKKLNCKTCKQDFLFTSGEQVYFALLALKNEPAHCSDCRITARLNRKGLAEKLTEVDCADCGARTKVPFIPKGDRPVYCIICLQKYKRKDKQQ